MMRLRELRICFEFFNQTIIRYCLPDAHPGKDRHEEKHRDDWHVIRGRRDRPELMPVLDVDCPETNKQQHHHQNRPFIKESSHHFFFRAFISDSSTTGAGPEMPPSLRMRQKCTAMNIDATRGIPMQCQI